MDSNNETENLHALEVRDELIKHKIIPDDSIMSDYLQVHGGADTTIYEISFKDQPTKYIQRIFRPNVPNKYAEFEYDVQKVLFENNVSVPQPFLMKFTPNTWDRHYFIMEKIDGSLLEEVVAKNPDQFEELMFKYLQELYIIHSVDPSLFPQFSLPDIQKNPYAPLEAALNRRKRYFDEFSEDLKELKPVFDWLVQHKEDNPCRKLAVVHGDYHGRNIIVNENQEFRILDWTGVDVNDFRRDLGFAAVLTKAMFGSDVTSMIAEMYEQISGIKVENLEYFMILENVHNLIRMYSGLNNHSMTNDDENTLKFFMSVKVYPLLLVDLIQETCGIELKQIKKYFGEEDI